jgi:hypothetical protein
MLILYVVAEAGDAGIRNAASIRIAPRKIAIVCPLIVLFTLLSLP